jgi:hypothetical protein
LPSLHGILTHSPSSIPYLFHSLARSLARSLSRSLARSRFLPQLRSLPRSLAPHTPHPACSLTRSLARSYLSLAPTLYHICVSFRQRDGPGIPDSARANGCDAIPRYYLCLCLCLSLSACLPACLPVCLSVFVCVAVTPFQARRPRPLSLTQTRLAVGHDARDAAAAVLAGPGVLAELALPVHLLHRPADALLPPPPSKSRVCTHTHTRTHNHAPLPVHLLHCPADALLRSRRARPSANARAYTYARTQAQAHARTRMHRHARAHTHAHAHARTHVHAPTHHQRTHHQRTHQSTHCLRRSGV